MEKAGFVVSETRHPTPPPMAALPWTGAPPGTESSAGEVKAQGARRWALTPDPWPWLPLRLLPLLLPNPVSL